jgi:DNA-3-methyladenine glycosylase
MHSDPAGLHTLPGDFFARDTASVARDLLGKVLVSRAGETVCGGRIVETEAYLGSEDPGSHAATKGVTERNRTMYGPAGRAYIYFTYGSHHMLNVVTEGDGTAGAVLIRAIEPTMGAETMLARRAGRDGGRVGPHDIANGPGKLAAALGVDLMMNGSELGVGPLAVLEGPAPAERIATSGRVGLSAGHDLGLRFYLEGNSFVSKGRTGPKPAHLRLEKGTR